MTKKKIFKLTCTNPECQKPFVYAPPARKEREDNDEEKGTGEVVVTCQYCSESVVIELPREYIEREYLTRGSGGAQP